MSKFEVQALDSSGYVDDSASEDSLEGAVNTAVQWLATDTYGNIGKVKIFELVEIPFVVEHNDIKPTGRPPVTATCKGLTLRTL